MLSKEHRLEIRRRRRKLFDKLAPHLLPGIGQRGFGLLRCSRGQSRIKRLFDFRDDGVIGHDFQCRAQTKLVMQPFLRRFDKWRQLSTARVEVIGFSAAAIMGKQHQGELCKSPLSMIQ